MIKVMIVEDDKLTRMGILASVHWEACNMQVVFDTGMPQRALEFLEHNEADLLLADISMPVMSGLELAKRAKSLRPSLQFALLTMHQNFNYVQEALRLGALDYICKSQFEQDDVEEILLNMKKRFEAVQGSKRPADYLEREGACYIAVHPGSSVSPLHAFASQFSLQENPLHDNASLYFFSPGTPISQRDNTEHALRNISCKDLMLLSLPDADNYPDKTLLSLACLQKENLFYTFVPGFHSSSLAELVCDIPATSYDQFQDRTDEFLSLKWIFNRSLADSIMESLRYSRIPYTKLIRLFSKAEHKMNLCYGFLLPEDALLLPEEFLTFYHARRWFDQAAELICQAVERHSYSPYIVECLSQALLILHTEYPSPLFSDDVARRVHLSRSYFCQIFKKMTHQSFNHYLRSVRLDKAKELLIKTNYSISDIAEKTGYAGEKYFSQLFHAETGKTPSLYRQEYRERTPLPERPLNSP